MKLASHSEREEFVLQFAKSCPQATAGMCQRLFRLARAHAQLSINQDWLKIGRMRVKIRNLAGLPVLFDHSREFTVRLVLPDGTELPVPTSRR